MTNQINNTTNNKEMANFSAINLIPVEICFNCQGIGHNQQACPRNQRSRAKASTYQSDSDSEMDSSAEEIGYVSINNIV